MLFAASVLSTLDFIGLVGRLVAYVKAVRSGEEKFAFKSCWNVVVLDREDGTALTGAEYTNLVTNESDEYDAAELKVQEIEAEDQPQDQPSSIKRARFVEPINTTMDHPEGDEDTVQWANHEAYPRSATSERTLFGPRSPRGSLHSDETLRHEVGQWMRAKKTPLLKRIGRGVFATAERSLVFAGLMQTISGIVVYTGGCRQNWLNGCLAHLISACLIVELYAIRIQADMVAVCAFLILCCRGRHLLVLWSCDIRPLPRFLLRTWLGLESCTIS